MLSQNTNSNDTYILGSPFVENFITELDFRHNTVRFSLNSNSTATLEAFSTSPVDLTLVILGSLVGLILLGCTIWLCCRRRAQHKKTVQAAYVD